MGILVFLFVTNRRIKFTYILSFKREIGVGLCTKTVDLNRLPGNRIFILLYLLTVNLLNECIYDYNSDRPGK